MEYAPTQRNKDSKMTILIVDDDPTNQIVSQKLLGNFNVIHALSGMLLLSSMPSLSSLPIQKSNFSASRFR
jgi:response regulator RpfG family c-di-GMP phosphodiesterase